jgi:hypothetical protein
MANFRQRVTEEVKNAASNDGGDTEEETLDQIDVDFDETPFVKFYPTTLPSGVFPANAGNPIIRFPDRDNNDGRQDQGYLGLVMEDISVITDEDEGMSEATILKTEESDTTEYRIVNLDDDRTSMKGGGDAVDIDGDTYWVEETVDEIEGRAILVVDRTAAQSVARTLDVNGATFAGMDEETGDVNGGLIEYAPNDEDTEVGSRYARNPELREGLYGSEVGVMVGRRSEFDAGATGYVGEDADPNTAEPVVGEGEDGSTHADPGRATYEELVAADERRDMMWYTVFDMETGDSLEPVAAGGDGSEPAGYSYLEWRFDSTAGNLPESDWQFVQEYIDSGAPTDEETILKNIEQNEDELSDDPNTDRMVTLIQNDAGQ